MYVTLMYIPPVQEGKGEGGRGEGGERGRGEGGERGREGREGGRGEREGGEGGIEEGGEGSRRKGGGRVLLTTEVKRQISIPMTASNLKGAVI